MATRRRRWRPRGARPTNFAREGATAMFLGVDGKPGGVIAIADPIKATTPGRARQPARGRHPHRHADRRQSHHRAAVASQLGIDESRPTCCRRTRTASSRLRAEGRCRHGGRRRQRRARRWPRPMSASPWAPAPRSRSRAPASRWSRATSPASCAPARSAARPCATSARTWCFAFAYNAVGIPIAAGVLYPGLRHPAQPDDRGAGDVAEFGLGHRQRAGYPRRRRYRAIRRSQCRSAAGLS
jgi:Cu+-exporting ATPase